MKNHFSKITNRLTFRIIAPTLVLILITGFSLYFFVLKISSDFVSNLITENMMEMSRDIYKIIDKSIDQALKSGIINDEKLLKVKKGLTMDEVEDFTRGNDINGIIVEKEKVLFSTSKIPIKPEEIIKTPFNENSVFFIEYSGEGYYLYKFSFEPWNWKIIIIKNASYDSNLISKVRLTYIFAGIMLLAAMFVIIFYLNKTFKSPLDKIMEKIKKGEMPDYKGIYEFEFLSGNISQMLETLKKETDRLNSIYNIAISKRGKDFFDEVTKALSIIFNQNSFIAKVNTEGKTISIISILVNGEIKSGGEQSYKDTICEDIVVMKEMAIIENSEYTIFPSTAGLTHLKLESFLGIPVLNRSNNVIGIVATFGEQKVFSETDIKFLHTAGQIIATELELYEKTVHLDNILSSSPHLAMIATDLNLNITYYNPVAEKIMECKVEEALGRKISDIFDYQKFGPIPLEKIINTVKSQGEYQFTLTKKEDSRVFHIGVRAHGILDNFNNLVGYFLILRDITERKVVEKEILRQNKYLAALHETTMDLISRLELSDLLGAIIRRAGELIGTPHGFIYLIEPDYNEMQLKVGTGFFTHKIGVRVKQGKGLAGKIWLSGNPLIVDDYSTWEEHINFSGVEKVHAMIGVPFKSNKEFIGVIGLSYMENGLKFNEGEIDILKRFAQLASIAFDNARLYTSAQQELFERKKAEESLREANETLHALIQASPIAIIALDTKENITMWNPAAESMFGWNADEVLGRFNPLIPEDKKHEFFTLSRKVVNEGSFTGIELRRQTKEGCPIEISLSAAPLHDVKGDIIGIMSLAENITEEKQRVRELEAIVNASSALRSAQNRHEMFPIILDQIYNILNVEGVALAMRDKISGDIIFEFARGAWAGWTGERIEESEHVIGNVISKGKPYICNSSIDNIIIARPSLSGNLPHMAFVPLIAHGQSIGALCAGSKTELTDNELRLFTAISDIAANAIFRSTLHEQTEQRMQRLTALHSIDMAITSNMNIDVTLDILTNQIMNQLKVDVVCILLLNPNTHTLEYAAGRGALSKAHQQIKIRMGEDYAGIAAMGRRNIIIPSLSEVKITHKRSKLFADEGFVSYYCIPMIARGQVNGVLELAHRSRLNPDREWFDFLKTLALQTSIAIENSNLINDLQRFNIELFMAYDDTIEGWSRILDLRDKETEGHTMRVTEMTLQLARKMRMSETELVHVRRGALLHDIGKMGIPDNILLKPDSLNDEEMEIMQRHPVYAFEMLSPIKYLSPALNIPYCHHEMWNGTGYPRGLKGEEIPLEARIFAIVDVWDALRSDRPYRASWTEEKVREHILSLSGTHFDPKVVEVFLEMEW